MRPFIFFTLMPLILGLSACDSTSTVSRATGIAYEVAVVMNKVAWDSSTGEAVKNELTSPVPYLPQSESSMRITYVRPDQFDGLLKYIRNILIVNIDDKMYTKVSLRKESDKWAMGQAVLYLNAPDGQSIETYLAENPRVFVKQYTEEEMNRTREFLYKNYSPVVMEKVKNKFGIELYAPTDILSYKDSTDCLWFSNDAAVGRTDLLIYSFPYTDNNTFTLEYLVAKRDSITKHMIPGSFAGSYMSVEKRVVDFSPSTLHGKYCGILRGLWRMEGGDMMGGPFVSYACVDEDNRRVIVTEGFVYEPNKEKKNYIRRLEAALQTTRLPANDTADIGRIPESVEKEKKKE